MIEDDIKAALEGFSTESKKVILLTRALSEIESLREQLETEQNHVLDRAMKIKAIEAERDAAVADARRIDFIAHCDLGDIGFSLVRDAKRDGKYCFSTGKGNCFYGKTFREAIDAAIAKGEAQ